MYYILSLTAIITFFSHSAFAQNYSQMTKEERQAWKTQRLEQLNRAQASNNAKMQKYARFAEIQQQMLTLDKASSQYKSLSAEYFELAQELSRQNLEQIAQTDPEARQSLETMDKADQYDKCVDGILGSGESKNITALQMQNLGFYMQLMNETKAMCAAGKRQEAKSYLMQKTLGKLKENLSSKQFEAVKYCGDKTNHGHANDPCQYE